MGLCSALTTISPLVGHLPVSHRTKPWWHWNRLNHPHILHHLTPSINDHVRFISHSWAFCERMFNYFFSKLFFKRTILSIKSSNIPPYCTNFALWSTQEKTEQKILLTSKTITVPTCCNAKLSDLPRNLCRPIVSLSSGDTPVNAVQFPQISSVAHRLYQFGLSPPWKSQIPNLTNSTLHHDMTSKWNYRFLHAALQYTTSRLNYQRFLNEDWRSSACVLQPSINLPPVSPPTVYAL